jgi:hypothetical protein
MPIVARPRASVALVAGLVLSLVAAFAVPASAADPVVHPTRPRGLTPFMGALAAVESGGRYNARNRSSGAFGRYQVMPSNWPSWAKRYLGDRRAKPTPRNQDRVAAGRLSELYGAYGAWDRVAYWWLTGKRGPRSGWSPVAKRYVAKVVGGYRLRIASPGSGRRLVLDDSSQAISYAGHWSDAAYHGYTADHARFATAAGAKMTLRFTGRGVRIEGPTGPTRGRIAVLVDGRLVRVVNLRAAHFHARSTLFRRTWSRSGRHRVELRVLGTGRYRTVAVDRVVIAG